MKIPKIGGKRILKCTQDKNTREVVCRSYKVFQDGTRQELAGLKAQIDQECKPVMTDMFENEEGELERLEKKITKRLTAKCAKNKPDDF